MTKTKLITVTFIDLFEPYGIKAGATRQVSESVAHKLLEKYHVIGDPFVEKKPLITVRVVKSLVRDYGAYWYPTSQHDVKLDMIQEHIDDGSVKIVEKTEPEYEGHDICSDYCKQHYNRDTIRTYLETLPSEYRVANLALRMQNEELAKKLVKEIEI